MGEEEVAGIPVDKLPPPNLAPQVPRYRGIYI